MALSDSTGAVPTSYTYTPFGAPSLSGSATSNAFDYTGRENDGTGLHYYRARYYHPGLQRFVSEDPVEFAGGDVNLYTYARNDPLNLADPDGLSPLDVLRAPVDLLRGAVSYTEGVCGTFRYAGRLLGLFGEQERDRAELEGLVVAEVLHQLRTHSAARQIAISGGVRMFARSAQKDPLYMLGRATIAYQIIRQSNRAVPGYGGVFGVTLGFAAVHGNLRLKIERGHHRLEDLLDAIIKGESAAKVGGRKPRFCGA